MTVLAFVLGVVVGVVAVVVLLSAWILAAAGHVDKAAANE